MESYYEALSEKTRSQMSNVTMNVETGKIQVIDSRPKHAGKSAQESGKLFEDVMADVFNYCKISYERQVPYIDHYGQDKKIDFKLRLPKQIMVPQLRNVMVECKQLGDCQSHIEKIDHCLMNFYNGSYGNHFWLVVDYNQENTAARRKVELIEHRLAEIGANCLLQNRHIKMMTPQEVYNYVRDGRNGWY